MQNITMIPQTRPSDDLDKPPTNIYAFRADNFDETSMSPTAVLTPLTTKDHHNNSDWLITLFYSNYSGNCKALLQFIKNTNIMDKLSIKFVNIDNTTIKKTVLKKFTVVPTMVVIKNDEMSLYSGNNVFEWFNIFMSSVRQQSSSYKNEQVQENLIKSVHSDVPRSSNEAPKTIMEIAAEISKAREN
jgi:Thioredoxin